MSKRGVPAAEKKTRLLAFFHESKEVYQLKDIEKIVPKAKGIVLQSIKDVLQELVDDGMVNCEKIGTSNYYWSFPSASIQALTSKIEEQEQGIARLEEKRTALEEQVKLLREANITTDEYERRVVELGKARALGEELARQIAEQSKNDPGDVDKLVDEMGPLRDEVNLWTENIWAVKSYCESKFNMDGRDFDKAFGIDDDFDLVD